ncbi:hypothetical protein CF70_031130 [Cupriavidus sp. SK-3]|uniref:hypothetical protein n=1 Tax=Cupriavidus sp. SK-3 TaxID=1470558 RepID=UPI000448A58D|nr:hypothetical protein [Cupriavidus sp. SK-3]KDP89457.1 hypothetical protein CF70_031130 [Cupriavidus sp. SK-3]
MTTLAPAPSSQSQAPAQRIATALLSARAILGAILTIGCYFIGATYYSRYLGHFHLDSQLFPLDTARYFMMGGVALFKFCASILDSLNSHPFQSLLGALAVVSYFACLAWLFGGKPEDRASSLKGNKIVQRLAALLNAKHGLRRAIRWALLSGLALYVTFASLLVVMVIIGLPAIAGEVAADVAYQDSIKAYDSGCKASGRAVCFRLEQDNKPPVQGFLIASSPEQIAMYNKGTVSVLPLKGNRLTSVSPEAKP